MLRVKATIVFYELSSRRRMRRWERYLEHVYAESESGKKKSKLQVQGVSCIPLFL